VSRGIRANNASIAKAQRATRLMAGPVGRERRAAGRASVDDVDAGHQVCATLGLPTTVARRAVPNQVWPL
jgi:hypothetical protein